MAFATSCSTTRGPETEAGGEGKDEEAGGEGCIIIIIIMKSRDS